MTSVPRPLDHGWWIASRSAGVVALVALTASVILGLLMANGLPRRRGAGRALLALHESTALAGLVAIAVHGLTLLGDPWLHATLWRIAVPGTISYRPLWTGLGIAGGWIAAALGLSFYARRHIGAKLWRRLHRATVLAWALGVAHTLGAGTDAGERWLRAPMLAGAAVVVFLFLRRVVPGDPKREAARRAASADAPAAVTTLTREPVHPHATQEAA
jgi:sulfoxide reductase heme-binding subunit YedZ